MRRKLKGCLFRLAAAAIAATLLMAILELGLRFLPVNQGLAAQPVSAADPLLHFQPDRDSDYSKGWRMAQANRIHTNNAGYVSDLDYVSEAPDPLIAIIGDSYVEATMVPWQQTAAARLATEIEGRGSVYSFGVSGAPLSHYLAQVAWVRDRYHASGYVILVVGNDFDESLADYKQDPGFHYFRRGANGELELELRELQISPVRRLVRHSRVGMYLVVNLDLLNIRARLASKKSSPDSWVGNTAAEGDSRRLDDSRAAVDAFLAQLPGAAALEADRIVIAVDGMRPQLYDDEALVAAESSYFGRMREYLLEQGSAAGFEMLDLQPRFIEHHRRFARPFEFAEDAHWNGLGHELFSDGIRESSLWRSLVMER